MSFKYSDGIAAARTMIALEGNPNALQRRLPNGWELSPYSRDDLRGSVLRGANMVVPFHEVYAVRTQDEQPSAGLPQLSYVAFISQARNLATGELEHIHWFSYTEDPAGVPGLTACAEPHGRVHTAAARVCAIACAATPLLQYFKTGLSPRA